MSISVEWHQYLDISLKLPDSRTKTFEAFVTDLSKVFDSLPSNFLKAAFTNFTWSILEYFVSYTTENSIVIQELENTPKTTSTHFCPVLYFI